MAIDDPSKYSFGWQDHPLKKSLAKIKRNKPESWESTSPAELRGDELLYGANPQHPNAIIPQGYVTDGPISPTVAPVAAPEVSPVAAAPGTPAPVPVPDGTNPHTGGPVSPLDNWMANGGSLHTFHNMQVKAGLRPTIDARTTPSPHEGMPTNTDIRAGWGWEPAANPNTGSQGSALIQGGGSAGDPMRIQANAQAAQEAARRLALQQARQNAMRNPQSQTNPNGAT